MEEKKKRGRPRKQQVDLPEEIKTLVEEVQEKQKQLEEQAQELQSELPEVSSKEGEWDVRIGDPIEFFDKRLSYELTGYKPITETQGLDFRPEWFTESRETFLRTGHYCSYMFGSKAFRDFWNEEYRRCKNGMTVNGYTITGFNYYFLNYYQLPNTEQDKAGDSRSIIFPKFFVYQYEFFHYFELCRNLRMNYAMMKNRGCGMSEINASIFDNFFNCFKNSMCLLTAFDGNYVTKTLDKVWNGITFTDDNTDGGMLKLRQVVNTNTKKRSTYYKVVNGAKIEIGFGSQIEGIVVDKDRKMRGDRVGFLFLEESGSNPILERSFIKAEELVTVGGNKIGIIGAVGTGGDEGPALAGLNKVYYHPWDFKVLPFFHNYTEDGTWVKTAYFMPAYITMNKKGYVGDRGEYLIEKQKEYYTNIRNSFTDPKTLLDHKAEQCFTAEEAFAAEGVNKFNKVKIAEQILAINIKKQAPNIERGYMEFTYSGPERNRQSITGVRFKPHPQGPVYILEHPRETEDHKQINNLYVAGIDGIDIGALETSVETRNPSKFATVIKRRIYGMQEPTYVAYYLDRPNDIREAYKQTIALLWYYSAKANIEATRLSLLTYARDNKFMQFFMKRPRVCYGGDERKRQINQYGTTTPKAMIEHQTDLIADYVEDYCHNIWFIELLNQLNKYTDENKGQFDLVAAMAMCEVGDEELSDVLPRVKEPISNEFHDIGYYKDENGYTRFGVIPKNTYNQETKFSWERTYEGYNITTNPYYR